MTPALQRPIGSTIYRFAVAEVVVGWIADETGESLATLPVDDVPCVLAFTDVDAAHSRLGAARLMAIPVHELLRRLPVTAGLLVDPDARAPIHIDPAHVAEVIAAAAPLPAGAQVRLGLPDPEPVELLEAYADALAAVPGVQAARRVLCRVEDRTETLLVVVTPADSADAALAGTLAALQPVSERLRPACPVDVVVDDDPENPQLAWIRDHITPFYSQ